MKKIDIQLGRAYFVDGSNNWSDQIGGREQYAQTAQRLADTHKAIAKEFVSSNWRGNCVLVEYPNGRTDYVLYGHIRATWAHGVKVVTDAQRAKYRPWSDRGLKYQAHLRRKADRAYAQEFNPAINELVELVKQITGNDRIWKDKALNTFTLQEVRALTQALSLSLPKIERVA